MEKVEQRDRLVIEHLKAVNVDPNAPAEEQQISLPTIKDDAGEKNTNYVSIMAQIEQKEKERAERQEEFKREGDGEEITLSDANQAQVEARKKELDAMLANMQLMESEFDELDEEFDMGSDDGAAIDSVLGLGADKR